MSFLCETACRQALRYDPSRSTSHYSFSSWLWDILGRRCVDWHRLKREGFHDRRYRPVNPIVLHHDPSEVLDRSDENPVLDEILDRLELALPAQ